MRDKNQVVEYNGWSRWSIRREDSAKITKFVSRKEEAIVFARALAKKNKAILSIFDKYKRPIRIENYTIDPYKLTIPKYR